MQMRLPICRKCGQPIWGNCLQALGENWHPEHFVCIVCQQPINDTRFQVHEGLPCHIACYTQRIATRCVYCGKPLIGKYSVDHWGQQFCPEHQTQFPACAYCGRLVSPQQREPGVPASQAIRCPICRAHTIETEVEARPLYSQLVHWVTAQGLTYNNLRLSLELCDRARLNSLLGNHGYGQQGGQQVAGYLDHTLGATTSATYMQNGRVMRTDITGIAVLQGLPPTLFQGVTVHEMGHVWLLVQGIQQLPHWAEEGFCELLSYRYYQELHTPESQYYIMCKERNADPVYGDGFRSVRASADRLGFPRFLETVRVTKQVPI